MTFAKEIQVFLEFGRSVNKFNTARKSFRSVIEEEIRACAPNLSKSDYERVVDETISRLSADNKEIKHLLDVSLKAPTFWAVVKLMMPPKGKPYPSQAEPPKLAEALVGLFAGEKYKDSMVDDMEELFEHDLAAGKSVSRARWHYWLRAIRSTGPQLWAFAKRIGLPAGAAAVTHFFDKNIH